MTDKSDLQKGAQMLIYQSEDGQIRLEVQPEADSETDGRVVPDHRAQHQPSFEKHL